VTVAPTTSAVPPADSGAVQPRNLKEAASQFEALLISQMLKSVHESGESGWLGTGDDQAGASMGELAEEHFAQALAAQGGMGVAKMVVKSLEKSKPAAADVQGGLKPTLHRSQV
jgi:Rod binding domain-containing protein